MRQHFTVKFVWAAVLLSIVGAGCGPAVAAQAANSEVRDCHYQARKIVSLKGPLETTAIRRSAQASLVFIQSGTLPPAGISQSWTAGK